MGKDRDDEAKKREEEERREKERREEANRPSNWNHSSYCPCWDCK